MADSSSPAPDGGPPRAPDGRPLGPDGKPLPGPQQMQQVMAQRRMAQQQAQVDEVVIIYFSYNKLDGSWKARFLAKNQHAQRKQLYFVNPSPDSSSKNANIYLSWWIFYVKNNPNLSYFRNTILLITSIFEIRAPR